MKRPNLVVVHRTEITSACIPLSEKLADHHAILQGYLDTHVTRNHSKRTIDSEQQFLKGWFEGFMVQDDQHPDGERSLMIWEAMTPVLGRQRIIEFSKGLITSEFKPRTVNTYLGKLRRLFQYVLDNPYIPGNEVQLIITKYGRIEQPVKEYDYPVHILDPEDEGFVLTGKQLTQFYDFIRKEYISHNPKKLTASRDYTMIVLAGESGLRANEILNLDALKPHRDIFYEHNCIQTRHGKGVKGSGKRIRKTIFTPLAQATLHVYEEQIRPNFANAKSNPALFLSESGERISYQAMWRSLHVIVCEARKAGLELPHSLAWHSLRKSFATNFMEQNPDKIWVLMDMMGHRNPSTLHCYVKHSRSYYDRVIDSIVKNLIPNTTNA
ncbi:tyrosine-type recombinase/integrase [Nostoc muscorum FACHB-395]|nr:tyrosine-type recombinase/integrase [Desmonostoc muscorum FACHB-395]